MIINHVFELRDQAEGFYMGLNNLLKKEFITYFEKQKNILKKSFSSSGGLNNNFSLAKEVFSGGL